MHKNLIFSDAKVQEEFLDRLPELNEGSSPKEEKTGGGVLEAMRLDSLTYSKDDARRAIKTVQENPGEPIRPGLEAIIRRFGRPAYFVQENTFNTSKAASSSTEVDSIVNAAKTFIDAAIPSVGRINLRNHRMPWVGTGWVVAPNVLVTNRHVASEFAVLAGDGFVFVETNDRTTKASLDTIREHKVNKESVFRIREVLWIAPPTGSHDVAFLSIDGEGEDDEQQPPPIELLDEASLNDTPVAHWTAVIGYPAFSIFNNAEDQQRIFEGVFDVKRLQPGKLVAKANTGIINHDATTLGGNSGSVVLDLVTGKALALHFGGIEGETNMSVSAPIVADLLKKHVTS
ncbi:MAG: serine protease [Planctomycetota bacterium]